MQLSSLSYYLIAKTNSLFLSPSREYAGSGIAKTAIEEAFPDWEREVGILASTGRQAYCSRITGKAFSGKRIFTEELPTMR
jgi:hypothetical protein